MPILPKLLIGLICLAFGIVTAQAEILYSNGAIDPQDNDAWTIMGGYSVSNSFVLSSDSHVGAIDSIGLSIASDGVPVSLIWSIGTVQFGADVAGPTSSVLAYTLVNAGLTGYNVYSAAIYTDIEMSAGSYWITLSNAVSTSPTINLVGWIQSSGPSTGHQSSNGGATASTIPSESFAVDTVPEPSTWALIAVGTLGAAFASRRPIPSAFEMER